MMEFLKRLWGNESERILREYAPIAEEVNLRGARVAALSDADLPAETRHLRARLEAGATLDDILPDAFAVVREAAKRTLGQRHFDAQILGGIALHKGSIAQMMTGEGKTLVATLPAYLNALSGKGVHVVTVNDYLSRRDAVWMGQIYAFLGLSVSVINSGSSYMYDKGHTEVDAARDTLGSFKVVYEFLRPCSRREAYAADITYGTNNEFGFDYLRDNLAYRTEETVQRAHHFAIVDEIDSILIDEARTPLIISGPAALSDDFYITFARIARELSQGVHFTVDEKLRTVSLTEEGITKAEKILDIENIYTEKGIKYVHHLETAVRAKALFHKDKEYVVQEGKVVIVDEFTGRLQPGRRWSEGLHQAIEAKEGVVVERESRTFASITFQNYFRMYEKLAGMTGTAETSAEEFFKVYRLPVVAIPTHRPIARIDRNDQIFQTERGKFAAVARKIKELNKKGQPVLIGTVSIEKSELLSAYLSKEGIRHEILNAKNHEREASIIAQAGRRGNVVIATNMAGRGVDVKLGGNPCTKEEYEEVRALGGLFVLGTERHEARRIDNQLRGRSGRQGDPGETQFFVSLEDSLMRVFASDAIKNMMGRFGIPEDQPIENRFITRALETAQEKIEGFHFDSRKHILSYDDIMNQQRAYVYTMRGKFFAKDAALSVQEFLEEAAAGNEEFRAIVAEKRAALGQERFTEAARRMILQIVDMLWMEHLDAMDYMRTSVGLRAYGQRDPLVEYKKEGARMFKEMKDSVKHHVIEILPTMREEAVQAETARHEREIATLSDNAATIERDLRETTVGRNDPCPCGSGKKFKKCHGR